VRRWYGDLLDSNPPFQRFFLTKAGLFMASVNIWLPRLSLDVKVEVLQKPGGAFWHGNCDLAMFRYMFAGAIR
jgi:hypothetical protein